MKYKIEFEVECADATPKQLRKFLKYLNFDSTIVGDIVTYPSKIKITKIKTQ